jgi:hypothetical protein
VENVYGNHTECGPARPGTSAAEDALLICGWSSECLVSRTKQHSSSRAKSSLSPMSARALSASSNGTTYRNWREWAITSRSQQANGASPQKAVAMRKGRQRRSGQQVRSKRRQKKLTRSGTRGGGADGVGPGRGSEPGADREVIANALTVGDLLCHFLSECCSRNR